MYNIVKQPFHLTKYKNNTQTGNKLQWLS